MRQNSVSSMRSTRLARIVFISALAALSPAAFGQSFYVVQKGQGFVQTSSTGAVPDPLAPFGFSVESATNTTLNLPSGATQSLVAHGNGDPGFHFEASFGSKAAL